MMDSSSSLLQQLHARDNAQMINVKSTDGHNCFITGTVRVIFSLEITIFKDYFNQHVSQNGINPYDTETQTAEESARDS
jgi:hypothetical protein